MMPTFLHTKKNKVFKATMIFDAPLLKLPSHVANFYDFLLNIILIEDIPKP
jgi:hypothetical protein